MTQPFTAYTSCPRCGLHACHQMRAPKPAPTEAEYRAWKAKVDAAPGLQDWYPGAVIMVSRKPPPRLVDESVFEVVRICECGHEWGMT